MLKQLSTNYYHRLGGAVELYRALHSWALQPDGYFIKGGIWYPTHDERETCCVGLSVPSYTSPWTLYLHCISLNHVARKFFVNVVDLSYALKGNIRVEPDNIFLFDNLLNKELEKCLIDG